MVLEITPSYSAGMFPALFFLYVFTLVKKESIVVILEKSAETLCKMVF